MILSTCLLVCFYLAVVVVFVYQVKKASAETETAWHGAGQKVGVQIWRIVKFKVRARTVGRTDKERFSSRKSRGSTCVPCRHGRGNKQSLE